MDDSTLQHSPQAVNDKAGHTLGILSFLNTLANETAEHCYSARSRSTVLQGLSFGGVPTVLAINFILWLVLLFVFSCLRKAAWDYGRLALLMDNDSLTSLFYGEQNEKEKCSSETSPTELESKDVGFCSWLTTLYHMRDDEIQYKCGLDAIIYLSFQRHILVLLSVVCVFSIAIILPVNFSGDLLGDSPQHFGRTTIANVPADDRLLWLHSIFALLYFVVTVICMGHHSLQLDYKENEKVARTLMISQIPKEITDTSLLTKHFHEAYPSCTVTDVQFCFDVRALMKLDSERRKAMKGRLYFTAKAQKEGKIMIKTHPLARICCCDCCGFEQVDAEQYYSELEEKLTDEFNAEHHRISLKRLGMSFVTFQDERMTAVIVKDYEHSQCRYRPQQSSITTVVKSYRWDVRYAPGLSEIIWENLSVQGSAWWIRCAVLNILLFLLLFFLTTPAIIVNTMDKFNVTNPVESLKNPIVTQFFPTLLLWTFSVLLPFIVYYSAFFECHWTRSTENQVTMHKCYFFLVFMVIILPSLGLTSLDVFFHWLFDTHFLDEADIKFQCVFLPDNGAFFVNYVITSSLIGTAMELLRIPGLLVYATRLVFAKSKAEQIHVKKSQAYEYQFGLEYAWTMCIFAVVMTYSITCPIIVPFGLLYMLLKHLVDRYNIYYACLPTKLNQRLHSAAVSQVIIAPILCMFWLLFFSVLRLGPMQPITLFTFVTLLLCIVFSLFAFCIKGLHKLRPQNCQLSEPQPDCLFVDGERSSVSSTPNSNVFVAAVLQDPELGLTPVASPAHQSYGTMETRADDSKSESSGRMQNFEPVLESPQHEMTAATVLE
ncbi:calcium permeable stress-gated cation channel 1 [Leucoraja erinacea]|uniref:calcium permeable stress-gated cation channel 1 n=1 Tax=Leucoraja erinaceus TaxID=7782 RepID=UPI002456DC5F|nr:calcium permeable stress-gated cation channel 1 [Leucoraja erinacea]XP_055496279.1 calcium permeable stress-gated cation channel 1 [Leucoraja erinacea]